MHGKHTPHGSTFGATAPDASAPDEAALAAGVRTADVLRTVREGHAATGKPVLVMTYWNPVDRYGAERFAAELAEAGGAGCILPRDSTLHVRVIAALAPVVCGS